MSKPIPEEGFYIDYKTKQIFEVNEKKEHTLISSDSGCSVVTKVERGGREIQSWANILQEDENPEFVISFEDNTIVKYG